VKTRFQMLMVSLIFVTVTLVTSNQLIRLFAWTRTNVISLALVSIVFVIIKLKTAITPPVVSLVHVKTVTKMRAVLASALTLMSVSLAPPVKIMQSVSTMFRDSHVHALKVTEKYQLVSRMSTLSVMISMNAFHVKNHVITNCAHVAMMSSVMSMRFV